MDTVKQPEKIIRVEDLLVVYGDRVILDHVNLEVLRGTHVHAAEDFFHPSV